MAESKNRVTLIGSKLAKPGMEFVYVGAVEDCTVCKVKKACHTLVEGRKYRVTSVRPTTHTCTVFADNVRVVDVEDAPVVVLIAGEMAIPNSRFVYEYICNREDCRSYDLCHPDGVNEGEKYTITQVLGNAPDECLRGRRNLKLVEIRPL
ncbi:MAG: UPF0179 family protein [Methanocalculus sp. MSAO_Arc1]|uniref:UPF0179 family protein n=1 Tax=Methanocalculus TaxID=71151 RepID=UPI000FF2421D|nr:MULTISPECIES: UPF0179 family protein [unclassified Methanocalculus]MCP1662422.1 uncharacterized protein (UPF0179 family) [Methanocalculus sp. AMF5]RQD79486.1 MAG: UPF0179 family protein [Methanocalculus sp. MSAO_Arc1]